MLFRIGVNISTTVGMSHVFPGHLIIYSGQYLQEIILGTLPTTAACLGECQT
jgi:hypothetical protein